MAKSFKVGEKYIIAHDLPQPVLAEVFVLTTEPGKLIGLKLPYKMEGAHSLDGRVEHGLGWWAHPSHLLTEEEFKVQSLAKQAVPVQVYSELSELVYDEATGEPVLHEEPAEEAAAEDKPKKGKK